MGVWEIIGLYMSEKSYILRVSTGLSLGFHVLKRENIHTMITSENKVTVSSHLKFRALNCRNVSRTL